MSIVAFLLLIESLLCNIFLQPTIETDVSLVSLILLLLNSFVLTFVLLGINKRKDEEINLNLILMLAFWARIFLLLWDVYARHIFVLPNSESDAVWYHSVAVSFAFGMRSGIVDLTDYSYYVGQFYKIVGVQKITMQFIHVYVSMYSIVLIYRILCMFDVRPAVRKITMLLVCFLPNLILITTVFLQEAVIAFLVLLSLYFYTKWWFGYNFGHFILAIVSSVCGAFLHAGALVTTVGFVVTYMFVGNKERKIDISLAKIILGFVLVIGMLTLISMNGDTFLGKTGGELSADAIVSNAGKTDRVSDSDYFIGIPGLPATLDLIVNSPIRMFYFVCSPLPWMWRGLSDIIAFFGSAIFYIYVVYTAWKAVKSYKWKIKPEYIWGYFFVLIMVIFVAMLMFGWGVSNTGTALRHREKFTYICAVLYAISSELQYRARELRWIKR